MSGWKVRTVHPAPGWHGLEETGSRLVDKNALKGLLHHLLAVPGAQLKECVLCKLCV